MWELPQGTRNVLGSNHTESAAAKSRKTAHDAPWRTFRHSITVTDYTVHVTRARAPAAKGKWIAIGEISTLPITGLTRKILKAAGII